MNRRAERDAVAALLSEAIARRSFEDFCKRTDSSYIETRHTRMLCQYLQALADGEIRKLMIFMPPRHGKTYHASERFPAFFEGTNGGDADIILASYTIDRARASSRKVRGLVREVSWPFPDVALDPDAQSVDEWRTTAGGIVKAAGVGGSMTGFGAHLLAIDDPIKGRAEANSLTQREAQWEWYREVARTRLGAEGRELLVTTRWHEDDIPGRIQNTPAASKWKTLRLPAIAEENDPLGRTIGEPLAPELKIEIPRPGLGEISVRGFESLYQGNPTPQEGDLFKRSWFSNRYNVLPRLRKMALFVDGAWKDGIGNDRSALGLWGTDGVNYYLIDAWADKVEYPDLKAKVKDYWNRWNDRNLAPTFWACVEDAASGIPIIQEFRRTTSIPIVGVRVDKSKYTRAEAVTPLFEAGKCFLPENAPWLDEWIEEHVAFQGAHDDLVDTTSGALARLTNATSLVWGKVGGTARRGRGIQW
jgi:predicted phage terminase large subunit-like protein